MNMDYRGRRATIMGLGHFGGGAAAARWLARQGAIVTVTDLADENALADSLPLLADVPIAAVHLGGHREEDFRDADLVVVNPAVRPDSPWLHLARQSGAGSATELELFIENCPAPIIGVTGSNGKSTTAAMIASILKAAGRRTFLGGNIGGSLLDQLPQIGRDDWVVLEISSFQLWHFTPAATNAAHGRGYRLHAEPSRLARKFCRLCGGQAADSHRPNARRLRRAQHVRRRGGLVVAIGPWPADCWSSRHTPCAGPHMDVCGTVG